MMNSTDRAHSALELVRELQRYFVTGLESVSSKVEDKVSFEKAEWLRNEGAQGGGDRYFTGGNQVFNRASVNVSHVHYADVTDKALASATAISTIIHPDNPHAPSVHMHFSWTEMKSGDGYWRMMADLNPSLVYAEDKKIFEQALLEGAPEHFEEATAQGAKYFYIPALERHRGVAHFYLEGYDSGDFEKDLLLANTVAKKAIDSYLSILSGALTNRTEISPADRAKQLAYHTLYLLQVLTLDRGTTSGLLIHDQNDLGIMGSLPAKVDKELLQSWIGKMKDPQDKLLESLVSCLPDCGTVGDEERYKLAIAVREHYQTYPDALAMQASGNIVPPTVKNHQSDR